MDNMKQVIEEIYQLGLEKCAGDRDQAVEFTKAFVKEAFVFNSTQFSKGLADGAGKALGGAAIGVGAGLAVAGVASMLRGATDYNLRGRFETSLKQAIASNAILQNAQQESPQRLTSFAETIYKFAPHVAGDPNLLAHVLSGVIHGDSMDMTTIKSLSELESRYQENRKNSMFTPKAYV